MFKGIAAAVCPIDTMRLLDTNNLEAKATVAFIFYGETNDPALQERGRQMLAELSTCTNANIAYAAYNVLAHGYSVMGRNGKMNVVVKPVDAIDPEMESRHQQQMKQQEQQRLKSLEASFAANTNDLDAKFWLAQAYFTDLDNATNRLRGMQMYEELLTNNGAFYATSASNILVNGVNLSDGKGGSVLVMPIETPRFDILTNLTTQDVLVQRPPFEEVDSFPGLPFCVLQQDDGWLISKGSKLCFYKLDGGKFDVTCPATRNITALAADKDFWWVGTDGQGLIRISRDGTSSKIFTQADGLLMPTISALRRNGNRLWIGFNSRGSGGLGYIDIETGKFIGMQGNANFSTRGDSPVVSIQAADEKSVWVCSDGDLQQYDSASGQKVRTIPARFDLMSINTSFLATSSRSGMTLADMAGVKIYDLKENHWTKIELSRNEVENDPTAFCADGQLLWAASNPQNLSGDTLISLVDMSSAKIIRRYAFKGAAVVYWISTKGNEVWFLAGLDGRGIKLCHFSRS